MDLFRIIAELREEKKRIDRVIAALEDIASGQAVPGTGEPAVPRRRGRPPLARSAVAGKGESGN